MELLLNNKNWLKYRGLSRTARKEGSWEGAEGLLKSHKPSYRLTHRQSPNVSYEYEVVMLIIAQFISMLPRGEEK